jgi:DNA helicase-2/ATP-dependent DNA helicase PcrA
MEQYISQQQNHLDNIITNAARNYYYKNQNKPNFYFDIVESCSEQWLLSDKDKKDLCYDRPSIGFTYSLWYQGKRINTFLKYFINQFLNGSKDKIEIFDLGAGAGAVQFAIGLVYSAMKKFKLSIPSVSLVNVDTSPFMLEYNKNYLWPSFLHQFPECNDIEVSYQINSWTNPKELKKSNIWVIASYLFDNSESRSQIGSDFKDLILQFEPTKILLTTSYNKKEYLNLVSNQLSDSYIASIKQSNTQVFCGELNELNKFRKELNAQILSKGFLKSPFNNNAKWDIDSLSGIVLDKKQQELGFLSDSLSLYSPPFKRSELKLNEKQRLASIHKNKPTKVIGPAGCGKSVVITERIKDLIVKGNYDPSIRILLTTFNKDLVKCLGDWIFEILDQSKIKRTYTGEHESWFCFRGNDTPSLYIYHFDILPTRFGKLRPDVRKGLFPGTNEEFHYHLMGRAIDKYRNELDFQEIKEFAFPKFLLIEYHRIIYGYSVKSLKQYQTLRRRGRGEPVLKHNSKKRDLIYSIINTYLESLKAKNHDSFITVRKKFLDLLDQGDVKEQDKFTHIMVDELQDCTYADYQIFYKLLKKDHYQNIVFAGDLAQSIQLGAALFIPKAEDGMMGRWENHFLEGSYRLPFRISEAMYELSSQINTRYGKREDVEVSIITPYRGAPPGARIIFVFAESLIKMVEKTKAIYEDYCCFFNSDTTIPITVYEKDTELVNALGQVQLNVENEHILKSKGLEKKFVFWSTRTHIDNTEEVYEFVYTILTRTCCMLVIGLSNNTDPVYHRIINTFRRDRIMLWDESTRDNFQSFCQDVIVQPIPEEVDVR